MSTQEVKSNNKYYLASRERILAKSKERYNKRSLDDKQNARTYQREYYRHFRSAYVPPAPEQMPQPQPQPTVEKPKPTVIPAVKENKSNIILTFN